MICSSRTTSLSSHPRAAHLGAVHPGAAHPGAFHTVQPSELPGVPVRGITNLFLHPELPRVIALNCVMHRVALESQGYIYIYFFLTLSTVRNKIYIGDIRNFSVETNSSAASSVHNHDMVSESSTASEESRETTTSVWKQSSSAEAWVLLVGDMKGIDVSCSHLCVGVPLEYGCRGLAANLVLISSV